jgi:hypothetical protein
MRRIVKFFSVDGGERNLSVFTDGQRRPIRADGD